MFYIDYFDGQRYNICAIIMLYEPFFFVETYLQKSRISVEATYFMGGKQIRIV
jgi:hypothetical protein